MNLTTLYVAATLPFAPTPPPGGQPAWSSGAGQAARTAVQAGQGAGLNWVFIGSILVGVVTALFAYIGVSQLASSRKGDVKMAGQQSAVAGIGTFWVALAIGGFAGLLVNGAGNFLMNVFTG